MIDFDLNGAPTLNNDISLVLQQIDILFDTIPTEVLGDEDYGTKYHRFLYDLNISNDYIKHTVLSDLNSLELFCSNHYQTKDSQILVQIEILSV